MVPGDNSSTSCCVWAALVDVSDRVSVFIIIFSPSPRFLFFFLFELKGARGGGGREGRRVGLS